MKADEQVDRFFVQLDRTVLAFLEENPDSSVGHVESLLGLYAQAFKSRWRPLSPVKTSVLRPIRKISGGE